MLLRGVDSHSRGAKARFVYFLRAGMRLQITRQYARLLEKIQRFLFHDMRHGRLQSGLALDRRGFVLHKMSFLFCNQLLQREICFRELVVGCGEGSGGGGCFRLQCPEGRFRFLQLLREKRQLVVAVVDGVAEFLLRRS